MQLLFFCPTISSPRRAAQKKYTPSLAGAAQSGQSCCLSTAREENCASEVRVSSTNTGQGLYLHGTAYLRARPRLCSGRLRHPACRLLPCDGWRQNAVCCKGPLAECSGCCSTECGPPSSGSYSSCTLATASSPGANDQRDRAAVCGLAHGPAADGRLQRRVPVHAAPDGPAGGAARQPRARAGAGRLRLPLGGAGELGRPLAGPAPLRVRPRASHVPPDQPRRRLQGGRAKRQDVPPRPGQLLHGLRRRRLALGHAGGGHQAAAAGERRTRRGLHDLGEVRDASAGTPGMQRELDPPRQRFRREARRAARAARVDARAAGAVDPAGARAAGGARVHLQGGEPPGA